MDAHHQAVLEIASTLKPGTLLCPDYLHRPLSEALPAWQAVPYCARSLLGDRLPDLVILHKGMLGQLGPRYLRVLRAESTVLFANAVFVLHSPRPGLTPQAFDAAHLGPVEHFLHGGPAGRRGHGRAVIVSAWRTGNIGDDAVSQAARAMALQAGCAEALCTGPQNWEAALEGARLLLIGGGGLLYDSDYRGQPDYENVGNYTAPLHAAAARGIPAAVIGVGVQGIRTPAGRAAFADALGRVDFLSVRDSVDRSLLMQGLGLPRVHLSADLAFLLPRLLAPQPEQQSGVAPATTPPEEGAPPAAPPSLIAEPPPPPPLPGRPRALLSLAVSMGGFSRDRAAFAAYLRGLVEALQPSHEVILARHSVDDGAIYAQVSAETGAACLPLDEGSVEAALQLYATAALVVTSRYHGLIFGALGGARLAAVADTTGKIGRLIQTRMPSLTPATLFLTGPMRQPPARLAEIARPVDPAELEACIEAAASDLTRLRNLL
nr:polysaccharide pyruvyl transferase family protein [Roseomonas sp. GC11]